ncbi:MAG: MerC domain-containing protein [Bacteroidota bacterium]
MKSDAVGLLLSVLCGIHCLALPVAMSVMPVLGDSVLMSHTTEHVILAVGFLFGAYVFIRDYQHHKLRLPVLLFLSGMGIVIMRELGITDLPAMLLTILGSGLSIAAFVVNYKHRKACSHNH